LTGGYYHSCALVDSAAKCWGSNSFGELGNNAAPTPSTSAVQVQGLTSDVSSIAAGVNVHTCALVAGQMRCWGNNDYGELGDGSTTRSPVPVQVQGLSSSVTAIAVGARCRVPSARTSSLDFHLLFVVHATKVSNVALSTLRVHST